MRELTPEVQEQELERLRGVVPRDLPVLRRVARKDRAPAPYLCDVTLNTYSGRSRPADLCVMRDSDERYLTEAVLIITDRAQWESIAQDDAGMRRWEGAVQRICVVMPGYCDFVEPSELPDGWGLYVHDLRGSGYLFALREAEFLNAPTDEFTLSLRDARGAKVRLDPEPAP
jgi:hypothetical protein